MNVNRNTGRNKASCTCSNRNNFLLVRQIISLKMDEEYHLQLQLQFIVYSYIFNIRQIVS